MHVVSCTPHLTPADLPLEKLAGNPHLSPNQKVAEVSRQFEAILIRKILSDAQKPLFKSSSSGSSVCGDVYRDLMTSQLADQISRSGLGLANGLQSQLQRQLSTQTEDEQGPVQRGTPPGPQL